MRKVTTLLIVLAIGSVEGSAIASIARQTLDAVCNRTTETVTNQSAILVSQSTLSYDERDRLTERSDPIQALIISQTWDANDNRTGQTINGETRTFTYDVRDRLVTLQQPGAPDGHGCPNVAGAGCAGAIPLIRYDYNSDGLRTKKTQGGAEARYQYDHSRLIAETNAIGNTLSRLHYGATQLLARTEAGSTPSHRNYLLDALNSPIVLTNNDGSISARTKYDAFGEILAQQGTAGQLTTPNPNAATAALLTTDQQPIGFTGYQKDEESGLYYAKARYYDPTVARFTTEDPEAGKAERPPSLHRYLYAYANPTIYIDPDGRQSCPVALSASECHALTAERLGVDPYSREGARAVAEFEAGLTIGQLRGAWTAVKETAQFVADVPGSAIDLIPGVDVGSLDRMGERASNAWEFVKAPVQTVKIAAQAQGTAYAESLEAGDYRGAGEVQGNLEGGIVASAAMSYTGAGLSNLARSSRLLGMADQQSKALVVVESASTMRAAVNPLQVTESVAAVRANPWNEFQKATRGQFVSRADAAQAYKTLYNEQSPWPQGYDGGNLVLLPGARVNMAMAPTQSSNRPGGWVTFDPIPDVDYVRRRLAVSAEFKPEIDRVVSYEVTQPMPGRHGPVGPQIDRKTGAYLEGMGTQIELGVSRDDRMKYLKLVDEEGLQ